MTDYYDKTVNFEALSKPERIYLVATLQFYAASRLCRILYFDKELSSEEERSAQVARYRETCERFDKTLAYLEWEWTRSTADPWPLNDINPVWNYILQQRSLGDESLYGMPSLVGLSLQERIILTGTLRFEVQYHRTLLGLGRVLQDKPESFEAGWAKLGTEDFLLTLMLKKLLEENGNNFSPIAAIQQLWDRMLSGNLPYEDAGT